MSTTLLVVGIGLVWIVIGALTGVAVGKMIARRNAQVPVFPQRHDWVGWIPVDEPGISDHDDGRWARYEVHCPRCGEVRRVWHSVSREQLYSSICPGVGS